MPILVLLASHWLSMAGTALVTFAGICWLFLLPLHIHGSASNPYTGLLVFIALPIVFFLGLAMIPAGLALAKRRGNVPSQIPWRRVALFFVLTTAANVVIGSQLTYRAVEHMETVSFCGQTCHVMKPEFTGHLSTPHKGVACVACHVAPGVGGWVQAKTSGTRQLADVLLNRYQRPIESAMASGRLISSADTCEQCHSRDAVVGARLRTLSKFAADEQNTRTWTVLKMKSNEIHRAHLGPGVRIRYTAQDRPRQTIPRIDYSQAGVERTYLSPNTKADSALPVFEMQCVDCHNRPAHAFESAEHGVDQALASGALPADLPFLKKTGVRLLQAEYASGDEAERGIRAGVSEFYKKAAPNQVQAAGDVLVAIYQRNVFPDLKVTWGTYPNNLGHVDTPGCFRCHDNEHTSPDHKTISQDCSLCHQVLAVEEASPEVLKTLEIK